VFPITSASILVRRKQSSASPGVQTMGSRLLNKVLPFADATFDVIASDFVFEHIDAPDRVARELDRVLKPGG